MLKILVAKKTKKQKLLAEKRRLESLLKEKSPQLETKPVERPTPVFSFQPSSKIASVPTASVASSDYSYVFSDLARIGTLTAIAVCAQLILWFLIERQIIRIF